MTGAKRKHNVAKFARSYATLFLEETGPHGQGYASFFFRRFFYQIMRILRGLVTKLEILGILRGFYGPLRGYTRTVKTYWSILPVNGHVLRVRTGTNNGRRSQLEPFE